MEKSDVVLIGMDSNCSEKSTNRRYQVFQSFCTEQNLTKIYSPGPTFHHCNGSSSSNIDFFLVSKQHALHITNIAIECNQEHPENFSSHDPVFSRLSVSTSVKTSKSDIYSHTYTHFQQTRILWDKTHLESYQWMTAKILQDYEAIFDTDDFIPLKCQLYSELLVKSAEISCCT